MAMKSSITILLFLVLSFFKIPFVTFFVTAETPFYDHSCGNDANKYTANSAFERDLNTIFDDISSGANFKNGFYSNYVGGVHAIALCRADVKLSACLDNLKRSVSQIKVNCPWYKEAIGWADYCMLRYSSRNISGRLEESPPKCVKNNKPSGKSEFLLGGFLDELKNEAFKEDNRLKYAAGNKMVNASSNFYAFVQCTPDLNQQNCNDCLTTLIENNTGSCCAGQEGCRSYSPSCILRFETYSFINAPFKPPVDLPPASPPKIEAEPPPPQRSSNGEAIPPAVQPPRNGVKRQNKSNWILIASASLSAAFGIAMISTCGYLIWRRRNMQEHEDNSPPEMGRISNEQSNETFGEENVANPQDFPYIQFNILDVATHHFSDENKLGEGGFGPVYKGTLENGRKIAVKRLSRTSVQGLLEFKNEVMLIAKLQHKNLVKLIGCCLENSEKLLVYEFMANTSLDVLLFDSCLARQLTWEKRFNIIKGIARGIMYLHEDSRLKIIHRDLKTSNVLLDHEMNPKISDFGLARIFYGDQNEANTSKVAGTYGYMAPEYALEGAFSTKSDIFSFGVLLLEIISGKMNNRLHFSKHGENLLSFAWKLWTKGQGIELVDRHLVQSCDATKVLHCIHIGLLCVQEDPADRPAISTVVMMLVSDNMTLPTPLEPGCPLRRVILESPQATSDSRTFSHNEVTTSIPR